MFDKKEKKLFVLMEARLPHLYKAAAEYEVREKFKGSTLKGKKYTPLFQYFVKQVRARLSVTSFTLKYNVMTTIVYR